MAMANPLPFAWIERPLALRQIVTALLLLIAAGTVYCTLYCLIAFPPMHHRMMPVGYSAAWAAFALVPWFLAFEGSKRWAAGRAPLTIVTRIIGLAVAAACGSVLLELAANLYFGVHSRTLSFQLADQLPAFLVVAAMLGVGGWRRHASPDVEGGVPDGSPLPPHDQIAWITAAGNYVEIRAGSRLLIRRLTMRQAETMLDRGTFVRIHRSALVNRGHVEAWHGRTVTMRDGTVLRVGNRHRRNLAPLTG